MDSQRKKNGVILTLKFSVAAIILFLLVRYSQLNFHLLFSIILHPVYCLSVISIFYVMVFFGAWRWHQLNVAQQIKLSFSTTSMLTYFCVAFNNVLPGSVGGDVVRLVHAIKKFPAQKSNIILSALFDRITGLMGILATICIAGIWQWDSIHQNAQVLHLWWICLGISFSGILCFAIMILMPLSRINFKPIQSIVNAIQLYQNEKLTILKCLLISIIIQALMTSAVMLISKMMNIPAISPLHYAIAMGAAQIANLLPITPGGLGIGEMVFANILFLLNPTLSAPLATVFLAFRFFCTLSYLPGVFIYIANFKLPTSPSLKQLKT
jgi:uncharacterized membrane protein YbhN (UPF0104 family)